jgi:hypothetical protein
MARPRRAASPPPRRFWPVGLGAVVAAVLVGLVLAPGVRDNVATAPSPQASSARPTESLPSPTSSARTASSDEDSAQLLKACRKTVTAGDKVLAAARQGMRHWAQHVQAQTDADAGKITVATMNATFHRTRAAGPGDTRRYDHAVQRLGRSKGSCEDKAGAPKKIAKKLAACAERRRAQVPVLAAAEKGMADWKRHLNDMRLADHGQLSRPNQRWRQTYAAAPTRIRAYERAVDHYDPPRC